MLSGILNEQASNRDYGDGGFEQESTLEFVVDATAFFSSYPEPLKACQGKKASARGEAWRVGSIRGGNRSDGQFVIVSLIAINKSA